MCRSAADLETFFVEVARQHVPKWLRTPKDKNDPTVLAEAVENDEEMAKLDLSDAPLNIINEAWLNPLGMAEARGTPLRIGYVVVMVSIARRLRAIARSENASLLSKRNTRPSRLSSSRSNRASSGSQK